MSKIITTDAINGKFWHETEVKLTKMEDCMHVINVYPEIERQTVNGFGGAFTEASAVNFAKLNDDDKDKFIDAYYGENGLGYNLARVHIHSCDFALGNYTYVKEGDDLLESFDISHDFEKIIPMIKAGIAKSNGEIKFMASPWSPPAFMKTTNEMNNGGKLKEEYYEIWANYFVKFINAYKEAGVDISYISVQNEPAAVQTWDSCVYTAKEEGMFAAKYLGPALEKAGLSHVKIYVWDHNKEELFNRANEIMSVENADKYVSGFAIHWYTGDHFDAISLTKEKYPSKDIMFSEGCVEFSRFADSDEREKAEMYAHDILGNFKAGISGFIDWNLLLDEAGGPNHVKNFCAAPIMLDGNSFTKTLPYYYIGQFSKYVKRGAKVIATTKYTDLVDVIAFKNPDGQIAIIVLNKSEKEVEVTIRELSLLGVSHKLTPRSISTIIYNN